MEKFVRSGSDLLDLILGGGFALKRMTHVVGDPSTGKTQLAIEAATYFLKDYGLANPIYTTDKDGNVIVDKNGNPVQRIFQVMYCDAEAAFDTDYAEVLGFPVDDVAFVEPKEPGIGITLEDFSAAINGFIDALPEGVPGIFILDSLDSLPTYKEATTPMDERGGYGTEKSKELGIMFRTVVQKMNHKDVLFFCISQTRDNITGYGPKKIFSGGNAPKFYTSQRIMLKKKENLKKTIGGKEYIYGVKIEAICDKNKCGPPYGECTFDIIFRGGIDNLRANIDFLFDSGKIQELPKELWEVGKGQVCKIKTVPFDRIKAIEDKAEQRAMISAVSACVASYFTEVYKNLEVFKPIGKDI